MEKEPDNGIETKTRILIGTCGYSDTSLVQCGKFYPSKSVRDKLSYYCTRFPCVEIDTSSYAIPSPAVTKKWASTTVPGFTFLIKAFGLFTAGGITTASLPQCIRGQLSCTEPYIIESQMPPEALSSCWNVFNEAILPLYNANKLGCILFQFHFDPSEANLERIRVCRRRLDPRYAMAAEFRRRSWFTQGVWRERLVDALRRHGIAFVSADELEHETAQKDREQRGLPMGAVRKVLPIAMEYTNSEFHYVRIHRRHGTLERVLSTHEIQHWVERLRIISHKIDRIFFLFGTDWEDAPMRNAAALRAALPKEFVYAWTPKPSNPGILQYFGRKGSKRTASEALT